jgi:proliferating cell nuclear antigen
MKIQINDKKKKDLFVSLFHILKSCSSTMNLSLTSDSMHIQGMDKSHICLFNVILNSKWFDEYKIDNNSKISFSSSVFYSIISTKTENQNLNIFMKNQDDDQLEIKFESEGDTKKKDFKKSFKMPLIEYEYEEMNIPTPDYDAEFSFSSKQISDIFSQLNNFSDDIIMQCSENDVNLSANGANGEMKVEIPIDELTSFSIVEGEVITLTYSLAYINKMCITNKLSTDIDFSLSNECPLKINYDLGDDSNLVFFIAPKMNDA